MRSQPLQGSLATFAVLAALFASAASSSARAESTACTVVTAFPSSISMPGRYCLDQDVTLAISTGAAIYVTTDDVELDCNDHVVRTTAAVGNTANGLQTAGTHHRIRVRNCTFDGFDNGLVFASIAESGHRLQGNRVVRAGSNGMLVNGHDHLIEDNRVTLQRGGGTIYPNALSMTGASGLAVGNVIRNNDFVVMQPEMPTGAGSAAMALRYQQGMLIEGNVVTTILSRTGGGSYGIIADHALELVVRGNTILSALAPGVAPLDGGNFSGIFIQGAPAEQATNVCMDNVVGHFNGNINGCVLAANTEL